MKMLKFLFKRKEKLPELNAIKAGFVYNPYLSRKSELRDVERCFVRLFSSEDGQRALAHLQMITFHRALGPTSPDEHMRYLEGQRAMVATILKLIDRGRNG